MSNEQKVKDLCSEARHTRDTERLERIRTELERLGAWMEAREVERKIQAVDRSQAAVA